LSILKSCDCEKFSGGDGALTASAVYAYLFHLMASIAHL
jgi:hypothetical protein